MLFAMVVNNVNMDKFEKRTVIFCHITLYFHWSLFHCTSYYILTIFGKTLEFFCGETGQGTVTKISAHNPLGSPYNTIKILAPTPKNLGKLGENFFGGGDPRVPGGRRLGVCPILKMLSTRGLPPYKIKLFLDHWLNARRHSGRRKKWKFWKYCTRDQLWALCTPNMTDDGKLFMALTSTTGRLTNLKESPF